jgi:hypothetical protein
MFFYGLILFIFFFYEFAITLLKTLSKAFHFGVFILNYNLWFIEYIARHFNPPTGYVLFPRDRKLFSHEAKIYLFPFLYTRKICKLSSNLTNIFCWKLIRHYYLIFIICNFQIINLYTTTKTWTPHYPPSSQVNWSFQERYRDKIKSLHDYPPQC